MIERVSDIFVRRGKNSRYYENENNTFYYERRNIMTIGTFVAGLAIVAVSIVMNLPDENQTKQKVNFESQEENGQ